MNFQTEAWMTRVVAQGKTTMARAILRPLNLLFRSRARMKPRTVDRTTTITVQTTVLVRTIPNLSLFRTFSKLAKPLKPLIRPVLVTWLNAMRKTVVMGTMMKIAIRMMLGAIQM